MHFKITVDFEQLQSLFQVNNCQCFSKSFRKGEGSQNYSIKIKCTSLYKCKGTHKLIPLYQKIEIFSSNIHKLFLFISASSFTFSRSTQK